MAALNLARIVASGFGAGFAPKAPGTVGSLLAVALAVPMVGTPALPLAALVAILAGLWAVAACGAVDDPGWVVVDEFAGQWLALLPLAHPTPLGLAAGFALFRLLDIAKPGPIGWADRRGGALGVMADDVIAGLSAALFLWALRVALPGVFDRTGWLVLSQAVLP